MKWKLSTPNVEINNVYSSTLEHLPSTIATVLKSLNKVMEAIKKSKMNKKKEQKYMQRKF